MTTAWNIMSLWKTIQMKDNITCPGCGYEKFDDGPITQISKPNAPSEYFISCPKCDIRTEIDINLWATRVCDAARECEDN